MFMILRFCHSKVPTYFRTGPHLPSAICYLLFAICYLLFAGLGAVRTSVTLVDLPALRRGTQHLFYSSGTTAGQKAAVACGRRWKAVVACGSRWSPPIEQSSINPAFHHSTTPPLHHLSNKDSKTLH